MTVNVCGGPWQPFSVALTVNVAVWLAVTVLATKLRLPVPLAPMPMVVLLFVQL